MGRPETGRTGARFGAPAQRSRHTPDPDTAHGPPVDPPDPEVGGGDGGGDGDATAVQDLGPVGARFGGRARRSRKERRAETARAGQPAAAPDEPPAPPVPPVDVADDDDDARPTAEIPRIAEDVEEEPAVVIAARPYVLTGGRTKVRAELRIETMVSATGPPAGESGERHTVVSLCARPRSVSEVAALTGVPLGVARVLIDDLAAEGRLRVHLGVDPTGGPDVALLDRVLAGLRRL